MKSNPGRTTVGGSKSKYTEVSQKGIVKIYLDTNIILDYFLNRAKATLGMWRFHDTKKLEFLGGILGKVSFTTSFLTRAEVARELAVRGVSTEEIEVMWEELGDFLKWEYIDGFYFNDDLVDFIGEFRMKLRTLMNFQHLFIAYSMELYFVTGDKDLVKISRERKIYDRVMSYIELRRAFSSS